MGVSRRMKLTSQSFSWSCSAIRDRSWRGWPLMFWIVRDWNQQLNEKVIMVSMEEFSTFSTCWCCWNCLMMASETLFVGDGSASIWDITSTVKMIRLQLSCQQSICFHISDELTQTLSGQFVQLHLITELHDVSVGTLSFPHTFHTHTFF